MNDVVYHLCIVLTSRLLCSSRRKQRAEAEPNCSQAHPRSQRAARPARSARLNGRERGVPRTHARARARRQAVAARGSHRAHE